MSATSLKPVIEKLESLFSSFNQKFYNGELQTPVITVSPDTTKGAYGWCTSWKAWSNLDPDSAIEYGNNPDLRNQCAEIAKYQKAVLRRTESRILKQIEKLRADIERDRERLKSCHHLDERSCEDRLHEDVAKHTAMYDALKIVSDMVTELEWLSNWKD